MKTKLQNSGLKKETVLDILHDAIIFDRLCERMSIALTGKNQWCEVQSTYRGVSTLIDSFNFESNSTMPDSMLNIFSKNSVLETEAEATAGNIYNEWAALFVAAN